MTQWHERRWGGLAIRIGGLSLVAFAWALGQHFTLMMRSHSVDQTSFLEFLLGMLIFLCASGGMGMIFLGEHLFDRIEISERWRS